jgi:hypothetical protein
VPLADGRPERKAEVEIVSHDEPLSSALWEDETLGDGVVEGERGAVRETTTVFDDDGDNVCEIDDFVELLALIDPVGVIETEELGDTDADMRGEGDVPRDNVPVRDTEYDALTDCAILPVDVCDGLRESEADAVAEREGRKIERERVAETVLTLDSVGDGKIERETFSDGDSDGEPDKDCVAIDVNDAKAEAEDSTESVC